VAGTLSCCEKSGPVARAALITNIKHDKRLVSFGDLFMQWAPLAEIGKDKVRLTG